MTPALGEQPLAQTPCPKPALLPACLTLGPTPSPPKATSPTAQPPPKPLS